MAHTHKVKYIKEFSCDTCMNPQRCNRPPEAHTVIQKATCSCGAIRYQEPERGARGPWRCPEHGRDPNFGCKTCWKVHNLF
jgi:hypothetical protein